MRLATRLEGDPSARPLVLLNSVGSTTAMWDACVPALAADFRLVRIDTRGHGASAPAPGSSTTLPDLGQDVVDTLDELGLERVELAGLSLGGMIAMWLAIHRPERVGRLALLCTSAYLPPAQSWLERAAAVRADGIAAVAGPVVERWVTPELAERDPELIARLRAMLTSNDAETYAQCCEAIAGMDLRADLPRIGAPTLVVSGAKDLPAPLEHQQVIADSVPGSRLEIVAAAAHIATVEQPGRVTELLREHLLGESRTAGFATRRAVLGDEHVDRAVAATTEFTAPFQDFITRYAWGEVWTRPGLSRRERSIATLVALTTLGAEHELSMHVRAALRNGLTPDELREVLLHTAVYAGVPRANRAFAIAQDVLGELSADSDT